MSWIASRTQKNTWIVIGDEGEKIALVQDAKHPDLDLIVSAPKLLEALRQMVEAYGGSNTRAEAQAMDMAERAIAMATGDWEAVKELI